MPRPLLFLVLALPAALHAATPEIADPFDVLQGEAVFRHLQVLADDVLEGRGAGSRGGAVAAAYAASHFAAIGLEPGGASGTYYQPFVLGSGDVARGTRLTIRSGEVDIEFVAGDEGVAFVPLPMCRTGEVEAEIVFAGYGITAPEYEYDDYAGLDVEGKIVLLLRHEPGERDPESPFNGRENTSHAYFQTKVENAIRHGAAAILLVTDPLNHGPRELSPTGGRPQRLEESTRRERPTPSEDQQLLIDALDLADELESLASVDGQASAAGVPAAHVDIQVAEAAFTRQDLSLVELQEQIDRTMKPASRALGVTGKFTMNMASRIGRNVLAVLPGGDPELAKEYVVLGAHYDHLGVSGETIFNGADDNASGTSGLLMVAEAFARCPVPPKRSLLFMLFDGEESGLLGSRYWVDYPTVPIEQVAAMINIDMIGRNPDDPVEVVGALTGEGMPEMIAGLAEEIGVTIKPTLSDTFMRSDQYSFYQRGIPVTFFSTGEHPQYHKSDDDPPLISQERLERVTRLMFLTVANLSRGDRPVFVNIDDQVRRSMARARGPRLGVFPRAVGEEESEETGAAIGSGIYVTRVATGTAAARAGVEPGDVILSIDGRSMGGEGRAAVFRALREVLPAVAEKQAAVPMVILRGGEEIELQLRL